MKKLLDDFLCVIPARGGSKGIPRKNLQHIGGKALVAHSIEQARDADFPLEQIIVSSDSREILDLAKEYSVVPHKRPDHLCTDESSTESALLDVVSHYPGLRAIVLLQPTSPIRFKGRIQECITEFDKIDGGRHRLYDSLLTVTKFYNFFWFYDWNWQCTYDIHSRPRRQDLKEFRYFDNGNVYITEITVLRELNCRIGRKPCIFPISELESMQIDTKEDLLMFQKVFDGRIEDICGNYKT